MQKSLLFPASKNSACFVIGMNERERVARGDVVNAHKSYESESCHAQSLIGLLPIDIERFTLVWLDQVLLPLLHI